MRRRTGVGYIKGLYPFMWAAGMIATGHLADRIGRKPPVVAFLLGVGTSLVYPTLLAAVSDAAHPAWRPSALLAWAFTTETRPRPTADSGYAAA